MAGRRLLTIAIPVPDPWGRVVDEARLRLQPGRRHMTAHITLIPPFRVVEDDLGDVLARATGVVRAFPPFAVALRGTTTFDDTSTTVFIPVVDGGVQCSSLRSALADRLSRESNDPMVPHVTIVNRADAATMHLASSAFEGFDAEFTVGRVCVYESGAEGWAVITAADTAGTGA